MGRYDFDEGYEWQYWFYPRLHLTTRRTQEIPGFLNFKVVLCTTNFRFRKCWCFSFRTSTTSYSFLLGTKLLLWLTSLLRGILVCGVDSLWNKETARLFFFTQSFQRSKVSKVITILDIKPFKQPRRRSSPWSNRTFLARLPDTRPGWISAWQQGVSAFHSIRRIEKTR